MRFVLLLEGQTEKGAIGAFLKRWLDTQLAPNQVGMFPIDLGGSGHFVSDFEAKAADLLAAAQATETIGVIGLLDRYGCPVSSRDASVLEARVGDPRFRMFFAVHETEAWLFSQPDLFPRGMQSSFPNAAVANPEKVNDTEPPSKLLNQIYRRHCNRKYRKTIDGRKLFAKLDPEIARSKCPALHEMLDVMLEMARGAGL